MTTIHKFPLAPPFILNIPADAKIIHVGEVANYPYVWVELDTAKPYKQRNFMVLGTGHQFPSHVTKYEHVGTLKLDGGKVMLHVYEELETNVH